MAWKLMGNARTMATNFLGTSESQALTLLAMLAACVFMASCSAPTTPPPFPAFSIAAGGAHTCSVGPGGGVTCAGKNNYGQLGDGTTQSRYNPVKVHGVTGAVQVTAEGAHTCALTSNGQVYCWGENSSGELGDGTTTSRLTAVAVQGLDNVGSIAAGLDRTCALLIDGRVVLG